MSNFTISDADLRSIIHIDSETKSKQNPQYIGTCPWCGKEKHFYINKHTQLFDCKKCGVNGSIYKLLKQLDKLYLIGDKSVEITDTIKSIRQIFQEVIDNEIQQLEELPEKKLPIGFKTCINNKYLLNRGLTNADCRKYKIGETKTMFKYSGYVLFPVYDGGVVRGYVGRYSGKKVPDGKLRYNNSIDTDFASLLYGYDDIVKGETETVIIVEGIFDKISCDKKLRLFDDNIVRCVCTFGKKISDVQINKLIAKGVSNIILSFDYDALKEIRQYGLELQKTFNTSVAIAMDKKDIDECSEEEVWQIFSNVRPIQEFCVGVIGKLKR